MNRDLRPYKNDVYLVSKVFSNKMVGFSTTWNSIQRIRANGPVVHCMTNIVAANFAADAVIAVGGSPIMATEIREIAQVVNIAQALTINIGTCSPGQIESIHMALNNAPATLPWVLDPVGVAATKYRQTVCTEILKTARAPVIRGNASEIITLAQCTNVIDSTANLRNSGIDSTASTEAAIPAARALAAAYKTVVAISGAVDYVVDATRTVRVANGHPLMASVTATGCTLTAVLGAFLANSDDFFWSTVHALSYYAVAGELAAREAEGPGSMHSKLLDYLYKMTEEQYIATARTPFDLSLYLVTDPCLNKGRKTEDIVREAIIGGVTLVQLREKDCDSGELLTRARAVKAVCDEYNVPLLIDDRVDIALAVDAAGIHIGQSDLPPTVARKLLGPSKIIGLSVSTPAELAVSRKYESIIDYIGVGPVWSTDTKKNAKKAIGLEGLAEVAKSSDSLVVAIGGIKQSHCQDVYKVSDVSGIAVVTAITMADDIQAATRDLIRK